MKRLVWFLIAAFCTALAQVQPVDLPVTKHEVCGCCAEPGACGMPDCAPQPASGQPVSAVQARLSQRTEAQRLSPAPRPKREAFYVQFVPRASRVTALRAPSVTTASASEPLFQVHCSFLL
jgi:hypothetical protein